MTLRERIAEYYPEWLSQSGGSVSVVKDFAEYVVRAELLRAAETAELISVAAEHIYETDTEQCCLGTAKETAKEIVTQIRELAQ